MSVASGANWKKKGLWLWTVISISGWGVLIKPPPPSPLPPVPTHVHVYRHDERTSTSDFDIGQYILIQVYKNRDLFSIFIIFIIIFLQSYYLWSIGFKLLKRGLLWEDEVFLFIFYSVKFNVKYRWSILFLSPPHWAHHIFIHPCYPMDVECKGRLIIPSTCHLMSFL